MTKLAGKRVLVVEDEAIVAAMVEDMLIELGAVVIGPATSIKVGLELAATEKLDVAVLDMNIRGETVEPVAKELRARSVPIVFASGYGQSGPGRHQTEPAIEKPFTLEQLSNVLGNLFRDGIN